MRSLCGRNSCNSASKWSLQTRTQAIYLKQEISAQELILTYQDLQNKALMMPLHHANRRGDQKRMIQIATTACTSSPRNIARTVSEFKPTLHSLPNDTSLLMHDLLHFKV